MGNVFQGIQHSNALLPFSLLILPLLVLQRVGLSDHYLLPITGESVLHNPTSRLGIIREISGTRIGPRIMQNAPALIGLRRMPSFTCNTPGFLSISNDMNSQAIQDVPL